MVVRAEGFRHLACVRQLVVQRRARTAAKAYRIGLHRLAGVAAHERHHAARIDATAQKRADRHVAHHLVTHGALELCAQPLVPALGGLRGVDFGIEPPVAAFLAASVRGDERGARRKFADTGKQGLRLGHIAQRQVLRQGIAIDLGGDARNLQQRLGLGGERELPRRHTIVERLDSQRIAGHDEPAAHAVPQCEPEHPVEALEKAIAHLFVQMHDDFGVAVGGEAVAGALELRSQLAEVVDLPVADYDERAVLVEDGLMAAAHIDDRQAAHAEQDLRVPIRALVVWTAVDDRCAHAIEYGGVVPHRFAKSVNAVDAAHRRVPLSPASARPTAR